MYGARDRFALQSTARPLQQPARPNFHSAARALIKISCILICTAALQGCAVTGDFGRPTKGTVLFTQAFHDVTDHFMDGGEPSFYNLTDDEIKMREMAFRLRMKVHAPITASLIPYNESGYANHLTASGRVNGPSRMATIEDEIHGDHEALTRFGQASRQVLMADRRRLMVLAKGSPNYSQNDADNAINRVEQNYAFMEGTFEDLDNRIAAFRHAVDRTKLETPAVVTGSVESSLDHLHQRSLALRYEMAEYHQASSHFGPMVPIPPVEEALPPPPHDPYYDTMKPAAPPAPYYGSTKPGLRLPPPPLYGPAVKAKPRAPGAPWRAKTADATGRY